MTKPLSGPRWRRQVRRDWEESAAAWERWEANLSASLCAVDPALISALALAPGRRVLDFGCGAGEPALGFAQLVQPRGRVLGLDVSAPMLAIARRRARLRGITNLALRRADVASARFARASLDGVVSRYGLMFVDDVEGTLARLRAALRPGGRIALAVWGPLARNPYFRIRLAAVRPFLGAPPPDPERSPHPLRFARAGRLARLLRAAGFRAVKSRGVRSPFLFADEREFVEMTIGGRGPVRELYDRLNGAQRRSVRAQLARGIRPYRSGAVIRCPGFAWVVSGRR